MLREQPPPTKGRSVPDLYGVTKLRPFLPDLQGQELRQLSSRDSIHRLKLKVDLDAICRIRANERTVRRNSVNTEVDVMTEKNRDEFAAKARNYVVFLLEVFLADISLNAVCLSLELALGPENNTKGKYFTPPAEI